MGGKAMGYNCIVLIKYFLSSVLILICFLKQSTAELPNISILFVSKNIPIYIISEGMGHNSESTTQIYLASLDNTLIDEANKLILDEI